MNDGAPRWVASNRYWRKCGNFMLVVAVVMSPLAAEEDGGLLAGLAIAFGLVLPLVLWMRRLGAWEEDDGLVIRSWFRTKRVLWNDIDRLRLIDRNWGKSSVTAAVQHGNTHTYLNSMVAVSNAGVAELITELEVLAERRGLDVDKAPDSVFRSMDQGLGGFRPFD